METTPPGAALWLAEHARSVLLRYFSPDCCIESTVLALDFLRARGITCRELSVQVMIFNAPGWRLFRSGSSFRASPTDEAAWDAVGAWSVGIGFTDGGPPRPNRFAGHLVALVEEHWLLDLSIQQASRPQRGIPLDGSLLVPVDKRFLAGEPLEFDGPDGVVLAYTQSQTLWQNVYRTARPWRDRVQRREILEAVEAAYQIDGSYATLPASGE